MNGSKWSFKFEPAVWIGTVAAVASAVLATAAPIPTWLQGVLVALAGLGGTAAIRKQVWPDAKVLTTTEGAKVDSQFQTWVNIQLDKYKDQA